MKTKEKQFQSPNILAFRENSIAEVKGLKQLISSFTKRISISYSSKSAIYTYHRAVSGLLERELDLFDVPHHHVLYGAF